MELENEKTSSDLKQPDTPTNKKHIIENDSVSRLVAWSGAFAFGCLFVASMFKRKKIISLKRESRDDDLNVDGFGESRKMEGLQLLLQSSSTDLISHSCHPTSETLVENAVMEDSNLEEYQTLRMEPILEKKDEFMVTIHEECPDSEISIENGGPKYDDRSSKVINEVTWLTEWTDQSSSSSTSSFLSSSLSSLSSQEDLFSWEILLEKIERDDKIIDIVIYIDNNENRGKEEA